MKRFVLGCAMALVLGNALPTQATLLVNEPFNYGTGSLTGANGGTGFAGAWGSGTPYTVAAGSLSVPGLTGTGNQGQYSSTSLFFISRTLNASYGATGTDVWASFLTKPIDVSAFSALDFGNSTNSLTVGILGGTSGGGPPSATWGMDSLGGGGGVLSSVPVVYGQTTLLVTHLTFLSGVDRIDLYVNPGDTLPVFPDLTKLNVDLNFSTLGIGVNRANVIYDEIRIGTTYADIVPAPVPEPGVLSILSTGLCGLLLRRGPRRRLI